MVTNCLASLEAEIIEETVPRHIRKVQYPDRTIRLQGAYFWHKGFKSGFNWKDLPLIQVDSKGQEFDDGSY